MTNSGVFLTPDGSPVELFARLPAGPTPQLIHDAIPPGSTILELGAGAGRITHALLELGHQVVAVDESPEMLAYINGAETIASRIEDLDLNRRFDVILLMSHLIEKPDLEQCRAFLRTSRAHVKDSGQLIIQRDPPERNYLDEPPFKRTVADGCTISMRDLHQLSPDVVAFTLDYHLDSAAWSQSVITRRVDDASLERELSLANLELDSFITANRSWVRARPMRGQPSHQRSLPIGSSTSLPRNARPERHSS